MTWGVLVECLFCSRPVIPELDGVCPQCRWRYESGKHEDEYVRWLMEQSPNQKVAP